jgi:hypothetical protein
MSNPEYVTCGTHGEGVAAVVCGHMLRHTDRVLGFVENSSDPDDLQAWCEDCEALFLQEQNKTERFLQFNDMTIVCVVCYARLKERHAKFDP